MGAAQSVLKKILSIPSHRTDRKPPRMFSGRDPDLFAIAEIEHRRKLDAERSLESVFEGETYTRKETRAGISCPSFGVAG